MRVSESLRVQQSLRSIEQRSQRYADAQRQITSGYRVERASDDPAASARILRLRGALARNVQYQRNMDSARIRLGHAELSLSRVTEQLEEVRSSAVQAAQETYSDEERVLMAEQVDQLLESLAGEGNRKFLGHSLYAGSRVDHAAFEVIRDDGGRIQAVIPTREGTQGSVNIQLDENEDVQVNYLGIDVFQGGSIGSDEDIFATLVDLRNGLLEGSSQAPQDALERIDATISNVNAARSSLGTRMRRVESVEIQLFTREEVLTGNLSVEEDADIAEAMMQFNLEQVGYEAALQSVTRVMSTNLLSFLR